MYFIYCKCKKWDSVAKKSQKQGNFRYKKCATVLCGQYLKHLIRCPLCFFYVFSCQTTSWYAYTFKESFLAPLLWFWWEIFSTNQYLFFTKFWSLLRGLWVLIAQCLTLVRQFFCEGNSMVQTSKTTFWSTAKKPQKPVTFLPWRFFLCPIM